MDQIYCLTKDSYTNLAHLVHQIKFPLWIFSFLASYNKDKIFTSCRMFSFQHLKAIYYKRGREVDRLTYEWRKKYKEIDCKFSCAKGCGICRYQGRGGCLPGIQGLRFFPSIFTRIRWNSVGGKIGLIFFPPFSPLRMWRQSVFSFLSFYLSIQRNKTSR